MVYSFYLEPEDMNSIIDEKVGRMPGVVSAVNLHPAVNLIEMKGKAIREELTKDILLQKSGKPF